MTKINQLSSIPDKTQLEEIDLDIVSIQNQNAGQWGTNYNCEVKDETGKTYCTFASIKTHDVGSWVGKKVNFKSSKNKAGQLCSIRVDKKGNFSNLYISNSVSPTVVGVASAPSSQPSQPSQPRPQPTQPSMPPNLMAKRMAEEWVACYHWTKDIFLQVLKEEQLPERVTGIVMGFKNRGIYDILPPPKLDWKSVIVREVELGKWEPERVRKALVKLYQGANYPEPARSAFLEAANETEFNGISCFGQMIIDNQIDEETANTILLRDFKAIDTMTDNEVIEVIANKQFIENCKQHQASQTTPFDQIDV